MNRLSTRDATLSTTQSLNTEELVAIREDAKRRAQVLRREAVSGLIDGVVAWVFQRGSKTRQVANARTEAVCHS